MEARHKVVVADPMDESGIRLLSSRYDVEVYGPRDAERRDLAIAQADAVVVRTFEMRADRISSAPRLKAIVKHGAGVDNIDIAAASARGIVVANSGDANAESVAEATVSLMFAAARRTPAMNRAMSEGRYDVRWGLLLQGICGRTLGLVGFGNIGRRVAAMCRDGFRMQVLAFDPYVSADDMQALGVRPMASLDDLLRASDVVSLHAGKSREDRPLIGPAELAAMNPDAILVNTARGSLVDEAALAEALRGNRLYGAGLDVLAEEPPPASHPLFGLDNCVLSPHVGGATVAARRLMAQRSAEAVIAALSGEPPEFWLNRQQIDPAARH